jgi:hypothetical protein
MRRPLTEVEQCIVDRVEAEVSASLAIWIAKVLYDGHTEAWTLDSLRKAAAIMIEENN